MRAEYSWISRFFKFLLKLKFQLDSKEEESLTILDSVDTFLERQSIRMSKLLTKREWESPAQQWWESSFIWVCWGEVRGNFFKKKMGLFLHFMNRK